MFKASTSSPESSETQTKPVLLAAYKDFIFALDLNVFPFSIGSLNLKSFGLKYFIFFGKIYFNSRNFPGLFVANKSF